MNDAKFFTHPVHDWQRRYEALRASFVERVPARIVAEHFGYSQNYILLLRHLFMHGKIDFSEPVPEGKLARRRVSSVGRGKIRTWREHNLSAGEITECLSEDGIEISVLTVERVLREEGFPKLPRRLPFKNGNDRQRSPWKRIHISHPKRKFPDPLVHESIITLRNYKGTLRQVVVRGNGHEKPAFLISNDFEMPLELMVGNYARRWRAENGIAEAVKFFHLNALSSPILVKVHFDVLSTMMADTLYTMLARKLRGFEDCHAHKIYRHFIKGKGTIIVENGVVNVIYPRRAHNPILRGVPWDDLPCFLPTLGNAQLRLSFR